MRKKDVGKGSELALSAGTGEERLQRVKLKGRMKMIMVGKFGRLAKGMILGNDANAGGEGDEGSGLHC